MAHYEPSAVAGFNEGKLPDGASAPSARYALQECLHELNNVFTTLEIQTALPESGSSGSPCMSWATICSAVQQGNAALRRMQVLLLGEAAANQTARPEGGLRASPGHPGLRIFLVEDNVEVRASLSELLRAWGCIVTVAGSTAEAELLLRRADNHLAIIDVHLDNDSGVGLSLRLRQAQPACRILLISGGPMLPEAGATADLFLEKPISPLRLRGALLALFPD